MEYYAADGVTVTGYSLYEYDEKGRVVKSTYYNASDILQSTEERIYDEDDADGNFELIIYDGNGVEQFRCMCDPYGYPIEE